MEDPIGIDIEYNDKKRSIESLGETIFSPSEKKFFLTLKSQREKEEAFLKAKGIGLAVDLANISVNLNEISVTLDWLEISTVEQKELLKWKLFPLSIDNLYTAAVVATFFQKHLFCYNANELLSREIHLFKKESK